MSILIKGMEMPKDGAFVGVLIWSDGRVTKRGDSYLAEDGKHYYRPCVGECFSAIPVPDHGRLVDADAFHNRLVAGVCKDCDRRKGIKNGKKRILYEIGDAPCRACFIDDAFDLVDAMPTIIPADKEGRK